MGQKLSSRKQLCPMDPITEVYYISGDRAPILSPVNDVSPKTWWFVTRFTSQSSYFYGEQYWPIVLTWKKQIFKPPFTLQYSKVEILHSIGNIKYFFKTFAIFCSVSGCRNSRRNELHG